MFELVTGACLFSLDERRIRIHHDDHYHFSTTSEVRRMKSAVKTATTAIYQVVKLNLSLPPVPYVLQSIYFDV